MLTPIPVVVGLNAVIVAVTREVPRVLTVLRPELVPAAEGFAGSRIPDALPFGLLDPAGDRTLERGLRRWVREQSGLELGYVEQLYTFGDRQRDPLEGRDGSRVVGVAYLALVREEQPSSSAHWVDCYLFFPWEDWRNGRPAAIDAAIAPALNRWVSAAPAREMRRARRERTDIAFGLGGVPWDGERVLERYELIYEVGLVPEALYDRSWSRQGRPGVQNRGIPPGAKRAGDVHLGYPMALDHRRMLATALGRLRGKLKYHPLVFELLPSTFTLFQLQRVVEALAGIRLHKQNLRRLVEKAGLVERTGSRTTATGGRPAELFRFRREVLRERPAPGVGIPGQRYA